MKSISVEEINQKANQCVKCGLCLNHCPTFQVTHDENQSPRGRIALVQAVNAEILPLTEKLVSHLDSCLHCLACEAVCPADVDYQSLIGYAQTHLMQPTLLPWFYKLMTKPRLRYGLQGLLWLQDKLGLRPLARKLGLPQRLGLTQYDRLLPTVPKPEKLRAWYPAKTTQITQRVTLWCGCISPFTQPQLIQRTIRLLNHLNCDVQLAQVCCGALWHHTGNTHEADRLYQQHQQFVATSDHWVGLNSGCSAHLMQTHQKPIQDISQFLLSYKTILQPLLKPLNQQITLHTPCTLQYPLEASTAPYELLSLIPDLQITHLNASGACCGGAGYHMMKYPEQATRILDQYQFDHDPTQRQVVATSNTGCLLHLKQYAQSKKIQIQIFHPVDYLYQALQFQ